MTSNVHEILGVEVVVEFVGVWLSVSVWFVLHRLWTTERCFKSVNVRILLAELLPHGDSSCLVFGLALAKCAIVVGEVGVGYLAHQEWENTRCFWVFKQRITVEENVFATTVAVEIAVKS